MGRWTDVAQWRGPIINSGDGDGIEREPEDRMSGHVGVVIHTAEGSYAGTDSWQRNPAADVGSHFLTAKDGRVEQLIDTDDRSWCQSNGNSTWISVENEGFGSRGESLSPGQVEACAHILAKAHLTYGVPLQVSNSPSTPGLGWHGMGGSAWGGHYDCPGPAIKAQLPAIVARAAEILGGGDDLNADQDKKLSDIHYTLTHLGQGGGVGALHAVYPALAADAKAARTAAESAAGTAQPAGQPTQEQVNEAVATALTNPDVALALGAGFLAALRAS